MRCAQSRGECPGARITLREGRADGARVDVVGLRDVDEEDGGTRRVDAAEGGGASVPDGRGGALRVLLLRGTGRGGGSIRDVDDAFFVDPVGGSTVRAGEDILLGSLRYNTGSLLVSPAVTTVSGSSSFTIAGIEPFGCDFSMLFCGSMLSPSFGDPLEIADL